jgi:hypothetical protein
MTFLPDLWIVAETSVAFGNSFEGVGVRITVQRELKEGGSGYHGM